MSFHTRCVLETKRYSGRLRRPHFKAVHFNSLYYKYKSIPFRWCRVEWLSLIEECLSEDIKICGDGFSGSGIISLFLKDKGMEVYANDRVEFCKVVGDALLRTSKEFWGLMGRLMRVPPGEGWFSDRYRQFFREEDLKRIQGLGDWIHSELNGLEKSQALTVLMMCSSKVGRMDHGDWTFSLKKNVREWRWETFPWSENGWGWASCGDVLDFVRNGKFDLLVLDPPYCRLNSLRFGHMFETMVRWDDMEGYRSGGVRVDLDLEGDWGSRFYRKRLHAGALEEVIAEARCKYLMLLYPITGYLTFDEIRDMLRRNGFEVLCEKERWHKRKIGGADGRGGAKLGLKKKNTRFQVKNLPDKLFFCRKK